MLVVLYNPTGEGGHQGGGVAAPIGGQLFSEILPYIDAKKNEAAESEKIVEVPNIEGITIEEARKILKSLQRQYFEWNNKRFKEFFRHKY